VPVYNTMEYLERCITSIMEQSYKNIEIILVNDGSTDESLNICKKFANLDDRIILIDKQNGGVSSARNAGLDKASGDYIGFVDSDDYISSDMYEKLIRAITESKADIAECGYTTVDLNSEVIKEFPLIKEEATENYNCSHNYLTKHNTTNFNVNKLYKKAIFDDIRYPKLKYSEDYVVNAKAFFYCNKKVTISDCCYYYVMNPDSACHQDFNISKLDRIEAGKEIYRFYQERFPQLCKYAAVYILNNIRKIYDELIESNFRDKGQYKQKLIKEYKKTYSLIKHDVRNAVKHRKTYIALWSFNKSPLLYTLISKIRNIPAG